MFISDKNASDYIPERSYFHRFFRWEHLRIQSVNEGSDVGRRLSAGCNSSGNAWLVSAQRQQ